MRLLRRSVSDRQLKIRSYKPLKKKKYLSRIFSVGSTDKAEHLIHYICEGLSFLPIFSSCTGIFVPKKTPKCAYQQQGALYHKNDQQSSNLANINKTQFSKGLIKNYPDLKNPKGLRFYKKGNYLNFHFKLSNFVYR